MIVLAKRGRFEVYMSPEFISSFTCEVVWQGGAATMYLLSWEILAGDDVPADILKELQDHEDHLLTMSRELHPE